MKRWIAATAAALMVCTAGVSAAAAPANAVFDFGDKAFLTLPMQQEESIYLALNTDYDRQLAQLVYEQTGREADCFYHFDTAEQEFLRTATLFLQAREDQQLYELDEDGQLVLVEADYTTGYTIGKDGNRLNGYLLHTKQPGCYILAD